MALFDKLFTKRKLGYDNHEAHKRDRPHQITPEQVRLLLFKECDWKGRKLLFDSSTISKVLAGKNDKPNKNTDEPPCVVEISNGFAYVYKGPATDSSVLGEMIFGAVAMNYRGVSLKIHFMDEPKRLMCTKVFCVPTSRRISRVDKKADVTTNSDVRLSSNPLSVPALREEGVSLSFSMGRGDSGYCGDQSSFSSLGSTYDYFSMFDVWDGSNQDDLFFHSPPGRKLSTSSNGSWQRRTFQNIATKFELGYQTSSSANLLNVPTTTSVGTSDSQIYSNSSASGTNDSLTSSMVNLPQKKNKLGLALLITVSDHAEMDEVRKCVEHSPQLQALVCRLRLATLAAGTGTTFVSTLYKASTDAAMWLSDLLYGPRLQPVWLSLVTSSRTSAVALADQLLTDLCSVLSVADTKHTNFFISTLLTHVLTYHLGWVTTVSPYDMLDPNKQASLLSERRRPYNALWAQLSDLCGAIGFPPRSARTIISGATNQQFVNRLLLVLTYFMRSGDVKRTDLKYEKPTVMKETKVISVNVPEASGLKRTATSLKLDVTTEQINTQSSGISVSTLVSDASVKKSATLASLGKLSSWEGAGAGQSTGAGAGAGLRRTHTTLMPLTASDSSLNTTESEPESERPVVFVLGDDEKLVGLKNKSANGRSVKKTSRNSEDAARTTHTHPPSPTKCCSQTLQHSKPIKHSGFKFEFDKYPQIVTNYMKSKNLEILDRHYIGKPGNLKMANFQFDPTVVPPIQEERCEICYKCQQMESMLQTPTNASELEYNNDMPRQSEPQFAKETLVNETENHREVTPKRFLRKRKENTVVVNVRRRLESPPRLAVDAPQSEQQQEVRQREIEKERDPSVRVREVVEFPMPEINAPSNCSQLRSGFDSTLLGGVTDHYVPDLILQGTNAKPNMWECELRRDLDLTSYLNKGLDPPVQSVAIIGDTNSWEVRLVGRDCGAGGGMSSLVGSMLDALPAMRRARVPAHQCLSFLEGKLRELCVLSKTLADMLMSTDFCDMATLTKSLNIDVNDVPLLLAVATTHTPQVATRYGISYR